MPKLRQQKSKEQKSGLETKVEERQEARIVRGSGAAARGSLRQGKLLFLEEIGSWSLDAARVGEPATH